jgi:hypothetical protein
MSESEYASARTPKGYRNAHFQWLLFRQDCRSFCASNSIRRSSNIGGWKFIVFNLTAKISDGNTKIISVVARKVVLRIAQISLVGYCGQTKEAKTMTTSKSIDEKDTPPSPPSLTFLKRLEKLSGDALFKALNMPSRPKAARIAKLTDEQDAQLKQIETEAIAEFQGDLTQLEAALGMLRMGHHFGWKVLYIIHSKKTIRTYEEILNIKIRDIFEESGPSSYRSVGFNLAQRYSNFWKVAGGDIKIPRRQDVA